MARLTLPAYRSPAHQGREACSQALGGLVRLSEEAVLVPAVASGPARANGGSLRC
ncbi:hypothetical protein CYA_1309 [Synechococcus sp. JA-3-3Ab]|nr:hypothetical protein CYA_1309 [Synechococcus sp. JA-3-3Ab]